MFESQFYDNWTKRKCLNKNFITLKSTQTNRRKVTSTAGRVAPQKTSGATETWGHGGCLVGNQPGPTRIRGRRSNKPHSRSVGGQSRGLKHIRIRVQRVQTGFSSAENRPKDLLRTKERTVSSLSRPFREDHFSNRLGTETFTSINLLLLRFRRLQAGGRSLRLSTHDNKPLDILETIPF